MTDPLTAARAAIDRANRDDPTLVDGGPRALVEGRRADEWVGRLEPDAGPAVHLAARAHHLRRWEVPRRSYPEGRAGYLRWRRDQKNRHAAEVAGVLAGTGIDDDVVARVQQLLTRRDLATDADVQLLEDAACLVFLEIQYTDMLDRIEPDALVEVVAKTLGKMSPAAIDAAASVEVGEQGRAVLDRAARSLGG